MLLSKERRGHGHFSMLLHTTAYVLDAFKDLGKHRQISNSRNYMYGKERGSGRGEKVYISLSMRVCECVCTLYERENESEDLLGGVSRYICMWGENELEGILESLHAKRV